MQNKNQKKKAKFRRSAKWRTFRKTMKQLQKKDFLTDKPLRAGWNLHHLDLNEDHYEDISDVTHFCCLNRMSHETVHDIYRYYVKDPAILIRLEHILSLMRSLNEKK